MHGIAREQDPAPPIMVRDHPAADPWLDRQDLEIEVAAGGAANLGGGVDRLRFARPARP